MFTGGHRGAFRDGRDLEGRATAGPGDERCPQRTPTTDRRPAGQGDAEPDDQRVAWGLCRDLLPGQVAAARGGLIGLDLAELAHIPPREAEDILHTAQPGGRSAVGPASALTAYGGMRACWRRHRPEVRVADTIGAGEASAPGLLGGLARGGLHAPGALQDCPPGALAEVSAEVVLASALTCQLAWRGPACQGGT